MITEFITGIKINVQSLLSGRWNKTRVLRAITLFRMREARGSGIFNQFWDYFQKLTILGLGIKLFNITLPFTGYIIIGLTYICLSYLLGFYDETKLKLWHMEQEMNTSHVNPYYQRIEEKLDNIEQRLDKHDKTRTKRK